VTVCGCCVHHQRADAVGALREITAVASGRQTKVASFALLVTDLHHALDTWPGTDVLIIRGLRWRAATLVRAARR
jgi:hypothetical protein